jgi:hypothetical protein
MKPLLLFTILAIGCSAVAAQEDSAAVYRLRLSLNGGYQSSYFRTPRAPGIEALQSNGSSFIARAMWHPEHMLSAGIATGVVTFAQDNIVDDQGSNLKLALTGIPMHIAFAMQTYGFEVGAGVGGYYLISTAQTNGVDRSTSSQFELGVHAWVGYTVMLWSRLGLGVELSTHTLSYRGVTSIAPHLRLEYVLVTY